MKTRLAHVATLALALAAVPIGTASLPPAAFAESADAPRIESFPVRGSGIERVRATVVVGAPIDRVRQVIFDYARYPEFMPRYERAAVLAVTPEGGRVVSMKLGGIVSLWMKIAISPPTVSGAKESYAGRLLDGNIAAFVPRWELTALEDGRTRVTVDSFLDPDLPLVPSGLINSGTRDGMREAIVALRARIEGPAAR